ncbi:MAG TPA: type II toxin-antitoxin system Phd/YefM family antitoxin [Spirochaetota bacterium]|nr:type II toxin-antitoxin system Phd/YefM family antitoxin [Spirochaetota bacterium]HNT09977.1 type II toxin-antitoxin system Phd/YefM family antitoxin [Spirochaetota bacterium]HNV45690.1 type II toxin-antitoxin system Phd/YefM family antitoxin [Spirochaetota bacterium]HOS38244.1 type II toxin-antitoxin system Phd/YefM family antitoxin [Spirochaetota bacterium]HPI21816.1 type II toxin-antitoxin system Phd/YefM family antitoxin [Spirochaetota bacterium]
MNIKEDIRPISYVKAHAADILSQISKTRRPLYVTQNGEAKAVILDTDSYQEMQKALGLLKIIAQGENDVRRGRLVPQEDVFSKVEKKMKK